MRRSLLLCLLVACSSGGESLTSNNPPPPPDPPVVPPPDTTPEPPDTVPEPPDTTPTPPPDTVPTPPPDTTTPPPVVPWELTILQQPPAEMNEGTAIEPYIVVELRDTLGLPAAGQPIVASISDNFTHLVGGFASAGAPGQACYWPPLPLPDECQTATTDASGRATFTELMFIGVNPGVVIRFTALDSVQATSDTVVVVSF